MDSKTAAVCHWIKQGAANFYSNMSKKGEDRLYIIFINTLSEYDAIKLCIVFYSIKLMIGFNMLKPWGRGWQDSILILSFTWASR